MMAANEDVPPIPADHDPAADTVTRTADERDAVDIGTTAARSTVVRDGDIGSFAGVTGDGNPLHISERYAAAARFGERVAPGMLIQGIVGATIASLPGCPILLSTDAEFRAPVTPDTLVTAVVEVAEALDDDQYRLLTRVDAAGETALTGEAVVLLDAHPMGGEGDG